jgi:hypothetical protein
VKNSRSSPATWWVEMTARAPPGRSASAALATRTAGVDPVERGRRQHHVERVRGQWPVLERGDGHLHEREAGQLAAGDGRQAGAELDRDDLAAPLGQRHGRLPRPAADLEHAAARPDAGQLGEVVEHRRGWPGRARSYRSAASSKVARSRVRSASAIGRHERRADVPDGPLQRRWGAAQPHAHLPSLPTSQGRRIGKTWTACMAWVWSSPSSTWTCQPSASSSARRLMTGPARLTCTPPQRSP